MEGQDLVGEVTCAATYEWTEPGWTLEPGDAPSATGRSGAARPHVVVYDYGVKRNQLRLLVDRGVRVTVVPAATSAEAVLALRPDGVMLSNGPGDPAAVLPAIAATRALLGKLPVMGICLGHQILSLALGARTYKLRFGHHGNNQPVLDLRTGQVAITSQNHGFAVDDTTLPPVGKVTHLNLNDRTVEGLACPDLRAFSVQYHPEAAPGPHDAEPLFDHFLQLMR
jgi:carbamoyl-phosphate synthase small subunit